MNILLIYPRGRTLRFGVALGMVSLGTILKEKGHNVKLVDLRYYPKGDYLHNVLKRKWDIIGFFSTTEVAKEVVELKRKVAKQCPDSKFIVGGVHTVIDPNFFLDDFDFIVIGEAENTVVELAEFIEKGREDYSKVKGIMFKKGNKVVKTPRREFLDLNKLPLPDYGLYPNIKEIMQQDLLWTNIHHFANVMITRGCPFDCTFCQPTLRSMFGIKVRRLSPERVYELLSMLKDKYKIKEVYFGDDLLLNKGLRDWSYGVFDAVNKLGLRFSASSRVNTADYDLLKKAKECGCHTLLAGVESGSPKVLKFYNKMITPDDIRLFFKNCKKLGIMVLSQIIYGAPVETKEDADMTYNLMKEIKPDMVWSNILTPYPGTHLYTYLCKHKVDFVKDINKMDRGRHSKKIYSQLPEEELFKYEMKSIPISPSMINMITRRYYRKIYFEKLWSLIRNKEFKSFSKFVLFTLTEPIANKVRIYTYKYPDNIIIKRLTRLRAKLTSA
ncbi:MAG: B12-binding domain-containing radical SAM protein [Nanoarchaeota archaeon]|nr:B12-binding domain-containing radical SAM protein [Nanoarchaeota archaeon]